MSALPVETVRKLLAFRHENSPAAIRSLLPDPAWVDVAHIGDHELRALIRFAAEAMGNGDPSIPRHLAAHRVLSLIPDEAGAALFAHAT